MVKEDLFMQMGMHMYISYLLRFKDGDWVDDRA